MPKNLWPRCRVGTFLLERIENKFNSKSEMAMAEMEKIFFFNQPQQVIIIIRPRKMNEFPIEIDVDIFIHVTHSSET